MKVGVNLLWLVPGVVGGSEESSTRLLRGILDRDEPDLALELFVLKPFVDAHPELASAFPTHVLPLRGRAKPVRVAAEMTWLPWRARRAGVDVMHHGGGTMPPVRIAPSVLTIHDLQPRVFPEHFSAAKRAYHAVTLPRSVAAARLVVTPSEFTRRAVIDEFAADPERVVVVPHGITPPVAQAPSDGVRERYGLPGPFFLFPAITYPHKNHVVLVRAFAAVAAARDDVALVLTGGAAAAEADLLSEIRRLGIASKVRRTGRIPWHDVEGLYQEATALTFPSRFEGFGLPVLEAMSRGCPVIAAGTTALPELVGDAGRLVAPDDLEGWTQAMTDLLTDDAARGRLVAAGLERAAEYTWDRSAAGMVAAYRKAVEVAG